MDTDTALPLQQHPNFATALKRLGRTVRMVDVAGAAPVLAVRQFGQLIASRGPVWNSTSTQGAPLAKAGLRLINADAQSDALYHAAGFRRLMTDAFVAELDLTSTDAARRRAMKPKWRNTWRRAQDAPFKVTDAAFDAQAHAWLLCADLAQQRAKRFRALPHAFVVAYAQCHPNAVRVLTAVDGDTPIAAMLFLLHAPLATYHIGWTTPRGRSLGAHHRMIIHAADTCAARGYRRLDMGSVDTDHAPGLARFKIGTGATVRPLGGTWLRPPGR